MRIVNNSDDSMFLFIDFVRVTNCFYDYEYQTYCHIQLSQITS